MNWKQFSIASSVTDLNRECKVSDPAKKSVALQVPDLHDENLVRQLRLRHRKFSDFFPGLVVPHL
jgi:hypothetical protein